ncbi:MAG: D-alanyl-D-alanine carboxypeptidase [Thermoleophilaceae bacterium]|jgi:D-alanyl-D-alanine carboxypeptidase|nr:D-alanyl-D-alanine carboxypeptidase [Thermoleophilaceae bacterium]
MRRLAPVCRLYTLVTLLLALGALAAPGARADFTPEQQAAMQQAIDAEMQASGYPAVVAGLWVPGQGSFVSATGVAYLRTHRPVRTTDTFRIGSITKTFTATVILQLVERGRLRLDDRLHRFVGGIPAGRRITIRQLLNHTSGIPDTSNAITAGVFRDPEHHWRPLRVIQNAVRQKRYCAPGKCWHYSNTNYQLLGVIARRITGRPMHERYERAALTRLHLDRTTFVPGTTLPRPHAHGYDRETAGGAFVDTTKWNFYWSWTAGSMTSTLADLRRWAPALATGKRLLNARMQRARLRTVPTTTPGIAYGLGIMSVGPWLGHDGAVPGWDSLVLYAPSSGATLVLLGNTAVELDATKNDAPPTLLDLGTCLVEAAAGQPCS